MVGGRPRYEAARGGLGVRRGWAARARARGRARARSQCRFVVPRIHFITEGSVALSLCTTAHSLDSRFADRFVPLFLKRQCDRTLQGRAGRLAAAYGALRRRAHRGVGRRCKRGRWGRGARGGEGGGAHGGGGGDAQGGGR